MNQELITHFIGCHEAVRLIKHLQKENSALRGEKSKAESRAESAESRCERLEKLAAELTPDAEELLMALHAEFYSGPKAHADAFRILPRVAGILKEMRPKSLTQEKEAE